MKTIKIPAIGFGEEEAARRVMERYIEYLEEKDEGEPYSPAIKLVGKYYVNGRFGGDPYIVYEFECFEDIQINKIEFEE